jgi:hypothetical protein
LRFIRSSLIVLLSLALAGCGQGNAESLDSFQARWYAAVNENRIADLYDMLDSATQRQIRHDLEVMRGGTDQEQQVVINQLGGAKIKRLTEISPKEYFARLWELALRGRKPTMKIEAQGTDAAYMVLGLDNHRERIRLMLEGGRWVWTPPMPLKPVANGRE